MANSTLPELPHVQQLALLDVVEETAIKILSQMGILNKVQVKPADPDETHCDPAVQVGAFLVMVQSHEVESIVGSRSSARYFISHEVLVPGVRYYPDGSGEPDDVDLVDDEGPIEGAENVAAKAIALELALQINQILQSWDEAKLTAEMEEGWQEMENDLAEKAGDQS